MQLSATKVSYREGWKNHGTSRAGVPCRIPSGLFGVAGLAEGGTDHLHAAAYRRRPLFQSRAAHFRKGALPAACAGWMRRLRRACSVTCTKTPWLRNRFPMSCGIFAGVWCKPYAGYVGAGADGPRKRKRAGTLCRRRAVRGGGVRQRHSDGAGVHAPVCADPRRDPRRGHPAQAGGNCWNSCAAGCIRRSSYWTVCWKAASIP